MTVEIRGLKIEYTDEGKGPVVLFLHGWAAPASLYAPILTHLSRGGHRVVAPNMPGVGGSQEPPRPWDVEDYVDLVQAFCDELSLTKCVLMGHSHGGRVILALASGEHKSLKIDKIILMDAAGLRPKRGAKYYIKVYSYKAAKAILHPFPTLRERLQRKAGSADYRAASPVMRGTLSKLVARDLTDCLPKIMSPTLLIWGQDDTATPLYHAKIMEDLIPDAGLVVFPGGHFACLENLPACLRVLDAFL